MGLEDSKLSHPGHESAQAKDTPAPHPGSHPEPLSRALPEAGEPPAPDAKELGVSREAGDEQGERGGDTDSEAALGAALEAARPVTDLLDEVGTGRWQHGSPEGAALSKADCKAGSCPISSQPDMLHSAWPLAQAVGMPCSVSAHEAPAVARAQGCGMVWWTGRLHRMLGSPAHTRALCRHQGLPARALRPQPRWATPRRRQRCRRGV